MMIRRMSDTCVQASVVIAALSGSPMPPAPTRPSTVDSRMLMSQRNTEMPANAGSSDRKSTRLNSSHRQISDAVYCLKKKKSDDPDQPAERELELPKVLSSACEDQ